MHLQGLASLIQIQFSLRTKCAFVRFFSEDGLIQDAGFLSDSSVQANIKLLDYKRILICQTFVKLKK